MKTTVIKNCNVEVSFYEFIDSMLKEEKEKFYKELAYHIAVTDQEYSDQLIEDIKYYGGKK